MAMTPMHRQPILRTDIGRRLLTAVIVVPILLAAIFGPPWLLTIVAVVGAMVALREFHDLIARMTAVSRTTKLFRFSSSLGGTLYIAGGLTAFSLLAFGTNGPGWVLLALSTTWLGDVGAYVVGHAVGRRPLAPSISPNKTVEGAMGGAVAAMVLAAVVAHGFIESVTLPMALALGLSANVLGQVGDLLESALKRAAGVKDSGILVYGYGGMLDKVDSLLVAAPWLLFCQRFVATPGVS